MRRWILFVVLMTPLMAFAEVLDIGIYRGESLQRVIVTPANGSYQVFGDGKLITDIRPNDGFRVYVDGQKVGLKSIDNNQGSFHEVTFIRKTWGNILRIKPTLPQGGREGKYNDNLIVSVEKGVLKMINRVYIEHYVGGVVEAESGSKQNSEYYKLQSIVCRTYALNNMRRHEEEGFHLCDQVHCQVYHGTSRFNELIPQAVQTTKGLVIVDSDINLITASFHSNCGGQTINAEDVWSMPLPYLQGVRDTFCLGGKHAEWETRISQKQWLDYLNKQHGYPVHNHQDIQRATDFNSIEQREIYYASGDSGIPLKQIRQDWNLKSTYFSVEPVESDIVISGRGFGHGVGMCQEGAMRMAQLGFSYTEIIHYYYSGVHLIDLSVLDFFKEY